VLAANELSPAYIAVIECAATDSDDVENVAWPPLSVVVPSVVAPSRKLTLPVAPAVTVAVKVSDWPKSEKVVELRGSSSLP